VVTWPSKLSCNRSTRGWSWSAWAARSWEKVCSASARTPAMRPWAPWRASANPSRALATWENAPWVVSRCGGSSATLARNRSPSLPIHVPLSSPRRSAAAWPAVVANRP